MSPPPAAGPAARLDGPAAACGSPPAAGDPGAARGQPAGASTRARPFLAAWRRRGSAAFELAHTTAGRTVDVDLWGRRHAVYANANLSIYSGQACNARCPFCVEKLRPASRGRAFERVLEPDDGRYFGALATTLDALRPLDPSVSVTGGEATLDPRLPRTLRLLAGRGARKRTLTTNGAGLLAEREGRRIVDWIAETGVAHLNVSRAHPDDAINRAIMGPAPAAAELAEAIGRARAGGTRVRLSCVLLAAGIRDLPGIRAYLAFARALGADNVVFRQLMRTDPVTHLPGETVRYSDRHRVALGPILEAVTRDGRFSFLRQVLGYYYYVEVWRTDGVDVVFEAADLAQLERSKAAAPGVVHELVFHPDGRLASTWQAGDGVLGP